MSQHQKISLNPFRGKQYCLNCFPRLHYLFAVFGQLKESYALEYISVTLWSCLAPSTSSSRAFVSPFCVVCGKLENDLEFAAFAKGNTRGVSQNLVGSLNLHLNVNLNTLFLSVLAKDGGQLTGSSCSLGILIFGWLLYLDSKNCSINNCTQNS